MTTHCPTCNTPWTEHLGIAGTCARLRAAEERLDEARKALEAINRIDRNAYGDVGFRTAVDLAEETLRKISP